MITETETTEVIEEIEEIEIVMIATGETGIETETIEEEIKVAAGVEVTIKRNPEREANLTAIDCLITIEKNQYYRNVVIKFIC